MIDLGTTNMWLGIMAAVSVLEALVLIGAGILAYRTYTTAMTTLKELEERQVAPLVAQVNEILADVRGVTVRLNQQAERVDMALRGTMDRMDETAERVKDRVRERVERVAWAVRTIRATLEHWLARSPRQQPPSRAASGM